MTDVAETLDPPQEAPRPRETRAVLPTWLHSRAAFADKVTVETRHWSHEVGYHGFRLFWYWLIFSVYSPLGVYRIARWVHHWAGDGPGSTVVELGPGDKHDAQSMNAWMKVRRDHGWRAGSRSTFVFAVLAAVVIACILTPWTPLYIAYAVLAVLALLPILGAIGKPSDKRLVKSATATEKIPKLSADVVLDALASIGAPRLQRETTKLSFSIGRDGVQRDGISRDGKGWRADVDLTPGVPVGEITKRRAALASALRRNVEVVWPEADPSAHAGRLVLWVGDKALSEEKKLEWPLARSGKVDLFQSFPLGVDQRGRIVEISLMYTNLVIGALPGMGKSFTVRKILLDCALDPTAELHVYDEKGGADYLPLQKIAHRFRVGDEDEDLAYLLADLRAVQEDMRRRYKVLRGLPTSLCPNSKTTRQLADDEDREGYRLHPVIIAMDECQVGFQNKKYGSEIVDLTEDISRRGRAVGISLILATQQPNMNSLPYKISTNAAWRLAMYVKRRIENDAILGDGSHKAGLDATMFNPDEDQGIGLLLGSHATVVRVYEVDGPTAEAVAERARKMRQNLGLLTGHAVGQEDGPQDETLEDSALEKLAAVWSADEDKVHCSVLAARLVHRFPDLYPEGLTGEDVTNAVKPYGMQSQQVKRAGLDGVVRNRQGLLRADLTAALGGREAAREAVGEPQDSPLPPESQVGEPLPDPLPPSEHEMAS